MKPGGRKPSDSDVRLVPDPPAQGFRNDSDVRMVPSELPRASRPSDSDVTLVNDDPSLHGSMR